ncbi:MAG TPA: hypothetical protein PKC20_10950, partial [Burkholderiaceae bacterium]|nr:hypothetical protein [Burkholderiaceae bacterium]
ILMARAGGEDGAPGGITAFLVDPTESCFEARRVHTMVLKATVTSELTFDGTVVPGANVLGQVGEGLRNILVTLGFGRLSVAAGAVGARAALGCAGPSVCFPPGGGGGRVEDAPAVAADLVAFFADRLKVWLRDRGQRHDLVAAVFALGDDDLVRIVARVNAL